ncbi:cyclase family protein [Halomicroarcula limicola]|uniref:Cyclase family protein n=1 Tax=Haloarcula limicola TaxID=1429915 RepID=A0A8J7YBQ6_9EURY|nr:cyclase family protein [Halomicroarcula limicola]MBV0924321.1 cyclase family protein [Halomicroarcula limicola]
MPYADLSQPIRSGMPVFPDDPPASVEPHATHAEDGYRVAALSCGTHTGTHVDAPSHTEAEGRDVDEFPVSRFVRDAVRVDLRGRDPRARVRPADLPTVDAEAVVLHTGWDAHWGEEHYFDHPFLTPAAARHCVEHGYDVAIDALNVDPTPTDRAGEDEPSGFQAHHELLEADRLIVENLTNLAGLPERFELLAVPLKIADGDGAPVRAMARYE